MRLLIPFVTMTAVLFVLLLAGVASAESTSVGRTLTVNGFEMYYEIRGEGEPRLPSVPMMMRLLAW